MGVKIPNVELRYVELASPDVQLMLPTVPLHILLQARWRAGWRARMIRIKDCVLIPYAHGVIPMILHFLQYKPSLVLQRDKAKMFPPRVF